jgi:hypothetical protein
MVDFQASLMFEELSACKTITHFFPIQSWTLWKITTGNIFCQRVSSLILLPYFYIFLVFIIFHDWELFFTWICCYIRCANIGRGISDCSWSCSNSSNHQAPLQSCPIPTGLPDGLGECWGVHATENWCTNIYYINIYYIYYIIHIDAQHMGDKIRPRGSHILVIF